jgi:DNA primase
MSAVIDLLEEKGIYYRLSGRDVLIKCLNPEHDDRNPSMRIDKVLGVFHCFSCGYKGSVFKHYNVDHSVAEIKREKLKRIINSLRSSGVGLQMPENYIPYLGNWRGIKPETYKKFRAFRHHDAKFQGRINFPITDASGRIVCFQGRDEIGTLDHKYMFHPSGVKLPLFPQVRPLQGRVILVEGIFDMLNLHDKGLENAICCFGVKNFTEEKLNFLKISGVSGLDLFFDGDVAGQAGVEQVKTIAKDFPIRTIKLKNGQDPGALNQTQVTKIRRNLYG